MTRIRYKSARSDTNAYFVSTQSFEGTEGSYEVHLNTIDMNFQILHAGTENIAASGSGTSMASIKSKAKKALSSLGVSFSSETRVKGSAEVAA